MIDCSKQGQVVAVFVGNALTRPCADVVELVVHAVIADLCCANRGKRRQVAEVLLGNHLECLVGGRGDSAIECKKSNGGECDERLHDGSR